MPNIQNESEFEIFIIPGIAQNFEYLEFSKKTKIKMVTLRKQKISKVIASKISPIGGKTIQPKKRPRGRPRKHPIVKSSSPIRNLSTENAKNDINSINLSLENEINNNSIDADFDKTSLNATPAEDTEDSYKDEHQWDRDIDHIELRDAIGQQFLEYCHLISQLEEADSNNNSSKKLKAHHEKLLHILLKAGIS